MKILTFQVESFSWSPFSKTLDDADDPAPDGSGLAGSVTEAVVAFLHAESTDTPDDRRPTVFRQTLKHIKWIANKRQLKRVVLHSFTHLSSDTAPSPFARQFLADLDQRLTSVGYEVSSTPFGWFCSWQLSVYGDSMAKVFKDITPHPPSPES